MQITKCDLHKWFDRAQVLNHYFVGLVGVPAANAAPSSHQPQSQASYVGGTCRLASTAVSACVR